MSDLDLSKYGLSYVGCPKVCVRVGNSNVAEVPLSELPVAVSVLIRFGFECIIYKAND